MRERIKVLLVEDSIPDATLITEVLADEQIDIAVDVVRDGEEALRYLLHAQKDPDTMPDLILLDLNLPKKDGRTVLAEVKSHPVLRSIPVIVLTTSSSQEDILRSYSLQASSYITKPIGLEEFTNIIKSLDSFWFRAVTFPARA